MNSPLPNNIEAEQALIGSCFVDAAVIAKIASVISPKDFYREAHQHIFQALNELYHEDPEKPDLITLIQRLIDKGMLDKVGGKDYLVSLFDNVATSSAWEHYSDIIKDLSIRRQMITQCQLIQESCFKSYNETDSILTKARESFNNFDIRDAFRHQRTIDIANVYTPQRCLDEYAKHIRSLKHNRFVTGIDEIDKRLRGVAGGEVLFIIARAGSFKTALLQNLLKRYINCSAWGAMFFSLEMPIPSIAERFQEIVQGSSGREIEFFYTEEGSETYRKNLEKTFLEEMERLFIIPTKVGIKEIAQYVRLVEKHFKLKIGVIGIDYLGLMDGKGQGEYELVSGIARDIKSLAKYINIPVIALTQTSRKGGVGFTEVEMDMARGSGAIEESADFCLGLFQWPKKDISESDVNENTEFDLICKILKNRKGPKGSRWKLELNPSNLRIGSTAIPWEPSKRNRRDQL